MGCSTAAVPSAFALGLTLALPPLESTYVACINAMQGFDNVNNILSSNGSYAPGLLIQIVVMKVIATAICRGSGLQVCMLLIELLMLQRGLVEVMLLVRQ